MNNLNENAKKSMKSRIVTALILIGVCLPCMFLGGWFFAVLMFLILMVAVHEFTNAPGHDHYPLVLHILLYIIAFSTVYWMFVKNNLSLEGWNMEKWSFSNGFDKIQVSTIEVASSIIILFVFSILHSNFKTEDMTYLFTMILFVSLSFQAILYLRYSPEYSFSLHPEYERNMWLDSMLMFYVVVGTFGNDTGAYFVGVFFGKHKMVERISPKKTWEGFVGGVIFSTILSFLLGYILAACGCPMLPSLTTDKWYWILLISLSMPIVGTIGDLFFSSIKRHFMIKDFGVLLPGHGGVLDRVDSLLFVSLVVAILCVFINNGWNFLL